MTNNDQDPYIVPRKIYIIFFPNGKKYVGQTTTSLEERWDLHVKKRKCPAAYDAIKSFTREGLKMLMIQVRQCYSKIEADEYEKRYIKNHKSLITENGYNLTKGGDGGLLVGEAKERHRQAVINREYTKPEGPTAATANDIEDAIHWVRTMDSGMAKRTITNIAGDLLDVSRATVEDHMKRINMTFEDARRICSDEQIEDALHWVMSQKFASLMNKTLVGDLVGNLFGSSRVILRRYLERHPDFTLKGLNTSRSFSHTEEAKKSIGDSKIGKKKSKEEIERRTETKRAKTIEEYASKGIDISDKNLQKVLGEYETAYKTAKYLTKDKPELFDSIRSILKSYIRTST
ncbi:hypothetical protein NY2A_B499L [Paramecium bursaria Chlorella virus NY2A]|uniref:Uncharacterized protein B499L n=1 Tax=Paramecium bursaria Chlorella virus NY2A TaxID=46021 RepID=A7IX24_PBCVN|nr:hypothetical protein NY2A_B499L [Paramecium bursaria Chlorella virus NY2A]YP_001498521.1 hypothetical protein AR158_C440L [Paramecium bursaria Chlorella virus AR158]ABT14898.1 hypothetical protein NY2A_B499L [Paramecium bursaria Chlorella virus NY2A]ABU43985.1 hypothetical protein AR158_C440L [Paramecium bursaria Chlorella virus AR158]